MVAHNTPPEQAPDPAPRPRCGAIGTPVLSPGTGPHAIRASCASCGRFLRWVSVLAPSERMARKMKHRAAAMRKHPASPAQLVLLAALGDTAGAPASMAEAHERIEALKKQTPRRGTEARTDVVEHIDNQKGH